MIIMRPSLKQHVGLLPDDFSRGPKLSKSLSCVASLDSAQPLSSYHIDALASRLSPVTKDIYREKTTTVAPTVGLAHGAVEFLKGSLSGIEKFAVFPDEESRFRKIYISFKFISPGLRSGI